MYKFLLSILTFLFLSNLVCAQSNLNIEKFLDGTIVQEITSDGKDLWIATNGKGIYKFDSRKNKFINYSTAQKNLQNDFFYCIAANRNYVWAGSIDGLFILNKKRNKWTKRKFGMGGQLSNWIRSVAYDASSNVVWIGRFKYLTKFDLKTRRFSDYDLTVNHLEKTNTIKVVAVDGDSLVWFGTEAGLHRYEKSSGADVQSSSTFYDNKLNFFDGEGEQISISALQFEQENIWIGLDEFLTQDNPDFNLGGLYKFNRKNKWHRFDLTNGLPGNGIYALERAGNYIWCSLYQFGRNTKDQYGRGLVVINRVTNEIQMIHDKNIPDTIYTMFFDGKYMWIGSDHGLSRINLTNTLATWNLGD